MPVFLAIIIGLLFPALAHAQVAAQTIYTIASAPPTTNGNFATPWGGTGFSMDGVHFMFHDLPACGLQQRWTSVSATEVTTTYPIVIKVLPIAVVTLWAPHEGFPLNDATLTRYYVCK